MGDGEKKWALVTGASGGLGMEMARELASRGWHLLLTARSEEAMGRLARELEEAHGTEVRVLAADLTDPETPAALQRAVEEEDLPLRLLVNNAGFGELGPFLETPRERSLAMLLLNVAALVELTHRLGGRMGREGGGRILNVASTAAFQPGPLMAVYYASKAFVLSFSEALREEFRPLGITVTTVCPGPTHTGFQEEAGMGGSGIFRFIPVHDAPSVARYGVEAALAGRSVAIPGWVNRLLVFSLRLTPRRVLPALVRRIQAAR